MTLNASSDDPPVTRSFLELRPIGYILSFSITIVLNMIGNTATIVAFKKVPALREKSGNLLILNLSIVDFGVGLFQIYAFPKTLFQHYWPYGKYGCQCMYLFLNMFVSTEIVTTLAIAYDRFLLISKDQPMYLKIQSRRRIKLTLLIIWIYGTLIGLYEVIAWDFTELPEDLKGYFDYSKECRSPVKYHKILSLILYIVAIFVPLVAIETLSILFVVRLHRRLKQIVTVHPGPPVPAANKSAAPQRNAANAETSGNGVNSKRVLSANPRMCQSGSSQKRDLEAAGVSFTQESAGSALATESGVNPEKPAVKPKKQYRSGSSLRKNFDTRVFFPRENTNEIPGIVITFNDSGVPAVVPSNATERPPLFLVHWLPLSTYVCCHMLCTV